MGKCISDIVGLGGSHRLSSFYITLKTSMVLFANMIIYIIIIIILPNMKTFCEQLYILINSKHSKNITINFIVAKTGNVNCDITGFSSTPPFDRTMYVVMRSSS
jgi:hypothetical protein